MSDTRRSMSILASRPKTKAPKYVPREQPSVPDIISIPIDIPDIKLSSKSKVKVVPTVMPRVPPNTPVTYYGTKYPNLPLENVKSYASDIFGIEGSPEDGQVITYKERIVNTVDGKVKYIEPVDISSYALSTDVSPLPLE